ncbi:MAG: prolipoprotein diacylglyceryl transferase [Planctomycetia bacterium]|nr:prolipoprotein diacylglyceryl transferase [Planctomycetia bacterium]
MRRLLFEVPALGLKLPSFGVALLLACFAALALTAWRARREKLNPETVFELAVWLMSGGFVGARLLFLIAHPESVRGLADVVKIWQGGIVFYGCILGGLVGSLVYWVRHPFPFRPMADAVAPALALGSAVGRVGCWLNGCCYGAVSGVPTATIVVLFPILYSAVGLAAGLTVVAFKWALMGRYRPGEYPLWSTFVWRTELVTALFENLGRPFLVERLEGTPFLAWYLRLLGCRIGKRVLLNSSEVTEFDLVEIGDDVALNEDCTIQTHLFEDRVMKMSTVRIGPRCTVGSQSVVLYDTEMQEGSSLNGLSLLMKGEVLPPWTRWEGSPARARPSRRQRTATRAPADLA